MMTNNVELKVGRYVIGIMPVLFFLITAFACYNIQAVIDNGQKTIAQMQKENSNLSKRLAASDLKRRDAEQELASQQSKGGQSPGVVIISPEGSKVHTFDAPRAYISQGMVVLAVLAQFVRQSKLKDKAAELRESK